MTTTTTVEVYGPNIGHGGEFDVHAKGCADIRRDPRRRGYRDEVPMTFEVSTRREVIEAVYADQIAEHREGLSGPPKSSGTADPYADWRGYEGDFTFYPCCKLEVSA